MLQRIISFNQLRTEKQELEIKSYVHPFLKETEITLIDIPEEKIDEETALRPETLDDFIGQKRLKASLNISIKASIKRGDSLPHILFHGPPGHGKTTLSNIIAYELGSELKTMHAPSIESPQELIDELLSLTQPTCIFIDEIHRLQRRLQEQLYTAMEDFILPTMSGEREGQDWFPDQLAKMPHVTKSIMTRWLQNDIAILPKFTLIGATTDFGKLEGPLRDRFGIIFPLGEYTEDEMEEMVRRSSKVLKVKVEEDTIKTFAKISRLTPRHVNRLVSNARDVADIEGNGVITKEILERAMELHGIDELGLLPEDRQVMETLAINFGGGPAGIDAISLAANMSKNTIVEIHEPHLVRTGLIERTPTGRELTTKGIRHLGLKFK